MRASLAQPGGRLRHLAAQGTAAGRACIARRPDVARRGPRSLRAGVDPRRRPRRERGDEATHRSAAACCAAGRPWALEDATGRRSLGFRGGGPARQPGPGWLRRQAVHGRAGSRSATDHRAGGSQRRCGLPARPVSSTFGAGRAAAAPILSRDGSTRRITFRRSSAERLPANRARCRAGAGRR